MAAAPGFPALPALPEITPGTKLQLVAKRKHDSQRSKVYAWEREFLWPLLHTNKHLGWEGAKALAAALYEGLELPERQPALRHGRPNCKTATYRYTMNAKEPWGRVTLPPWAHTPAVVLHEHAHALLKNYVEVQGKDSGHGGVFVCVYIELCRRFFGLDACALRASAHAAGVQVAPLQVLLEIGLVPDWPVQLLPCTYVGKPKLVLPHKKQGKPAPPIPPAVLAEMKATTPDETWAPDLPTELIPFGWPNEQQWAAVLALLKHQDLSALTPEACAEKVTYHQHHAAKDARTATNHDLKGNTAKRDHYLHHTRRHTLFARRYAYIARQLTSKTGG